MTENPRTSNSPDFEGREEVWSKTEPTSVTPILGGGRPTGVLLLLGAAGTVACSILGRFALGLSEDSGAVSFGAYHRHPLPIFLTYAAGMIAGVLFIVAAPRLYRGLTSTGAERLRVAAVCQAMAGLLLALSASRWLIVLPYLQKRYADPSTSATTRAAISVDYDTISYLLGITLGEHLFAILTGIWTIVLAGHLLQRRPMEKSWVGWLGIIAGVGWLMGSIEQIDFSLSQYFVIFLAGGPILWLAWTAILVQKIPRQTQHPNNSHRPNNL